MHTSKPLLWKRIAHVVGVFLLLIHSATATERGYDKPASPNEILFAGRSRHLGAIKLKMQFYGIDQLRPQRPVREWGSGEPVDLAIRSVELSVGKTPVHVPAEAFAKLLNITPVTVMFRESQGNLFLYMRGGDGAETYETRIEIARGAVRRRETVGGEFKHPQPPYERITFKPDGTSGYSFEAGIPRQLSKPRGSKIQLVREESD
jgi:hypothetical protein